MGNLRYNIEIGRADASQYQQLMSVLDTSFDFQEGDERFIHLLPKLYRPEYKPWENNVCVFEDGEIRAAVGLYYGTYHVCGTPLRYGGIGNVAVLPEARGKGYMKLAMQAAIQEMTENGTAFCVLDGQRQRYRYFGFDNAGACFVYHVTKTNLRHIYGADRKTGITIEPITADDTAALDKVYAFNLARAVYAERSRETLYDLLLSWHATPYKLMRNGEMVGYYVLSAAKKEIREFTLSDLSLLDEAVIAVVDGAEEHGVKFPFPPYLHEYCDFFFGICDWMDVEGSCKISVYRYQQVLHAFLQAKALEHPLPDARFACLIHGWRADEQLEIICQNGQAVVQPTEKAPELELSHLDAGNFFFANHSKYRRELPNAGAGLLPLPFFLFSQDHV